MGRFMVQADNGDIGSVKFEGGDGNKDILIPKEGGTLATEDFVTNSAEIITAGTGLQKSGTTLNFYPFGLTTASTELNTSDYVVVSDSTSTKKITLENLMTELGSTNSFQNSKSTNGYTKLPNGLILQWGHLTTSIRANNVKQTFPIAFPTACVLAVAGGKGNNNLYNGGGVVTSWSATSIGLSTYDGTQLTWLAIGY